MTKAIFYSKDTVQEVGYRVHIMQKIVNFTADLMVHDSMRSSQALMLSQLTKGIVYSAGMNETIKGMREEMREGFDTLPERIAKELEKVLK